MQENGKDHPPKRPTRTFIIGSTGSDYIRNELSTKPPRQVFDEFQRTYGIRLPGTGDKCPNLSSHIHPPFFNCQFERKHSYLTANGTSELPVLDLLDLHGVPRAEVYLNVLTHLRTKLIDKIETLSAEQLENMLDLTFPYIGFEELREIHISILKKHPNIPPAFLRKLGANPEIYAICPLSVQRQIWQIDEDLFKQRVFPLLNQYINSELDAPINEMLLIHEDLIEPAKRREQNVTLQQLVQVVGKSVTLYNKILHFFRTLFVTTKDLLFCTLRSELLMALHDQGVSAIYDVDPCHKFAWCLDACVRDNSVEERRIKEIQTYFDAVSDGDPVLGDLAMIINDPHATHTLLHNIFHLLTEIVDQEKLPSENLHLGHITQLLQLGLSARSMVEHQSFEIPILDVDIIRYFYPMLSARMLEDMVRDDDEPPSELDPDLEPMLRNNPLARKVFLYYLLTRVQARDVGTVKQLIHKIDRIMLAEDPCFIQSLITQLLSTNDKALHAAVIDDYFVQHIHASVMAHKQFIRYLVSRHTRIPISELVAYLQKSTSDVRDRDKVRSTYDMLLERMGGRLNEQNALFLYDYLGIKREERETMREMEVEESEGEEARADHRMSSDDEREYSSSDAEGEGGGVESPTAAAVYEEAEGGKEEEEEEKEKEDLKHHGEPGSSESITETPVGSGGGAADMGQDADMAE